MNEQSAYSLGIIATSNRFLKINDLYNRFSDDLIEKHTVETYVNNFCTKLNHVGSENRACDNCLLDGRTEYENWCTCKLLIYLNKSVVDAWRYSDGDQK